MSRPTLHGKTVLITGAARGLGAATARRLHAAGANVALAGLEPELMAGLAAELGDNTAVFEADVTDLAALTDTAAATAKRFGRIDITIANAGVLYVGPIATAPVEQVERTIDINLMGVFRTDRAVLPYLRESKGYLLNIASLAAASHMPFMGAYTASKAGVEALTDALRMELRPAGVTVGCAYFGFIDTDMVRDAVADPAGAAAHAIAPAMFGRSITVDEAVDAIEHGVLHRSERLWAPRFVGPALFTRGVMQPVAELALRLRPAGLLAAMKLTETDPHTEGNQR